MLILLIAILICSSAAAQPRCGELYVSYDLSRNFNETIAHTIHSMTVQGLRLFNPRATEDNRVPTVNHNIKDEVSSASAEPQKSRRRSRSKSNRVGFIGRGGGEGGEEGGGGGAHTTSPEF